MEAPTRHPTKLEIDSQIEQDDPKGNGDFIVFSFLLVPQKWSSFIVIIKVSSDVCLSARAFSISKNGVTVHRRRSGKTARM